MYAPLPVHGAAVASASIPDHSLSSSRILTRPCLAALSSRASPSSAEFEKVNLRFQAAVVQLRGGALASAGATNAEAASPTAKAAMRQSATVMRERGSTLPVPCVCGPACKLPLLLGQCLSVSFQCPAFPPLSWAKTVPFLAGSSGALEVPDTAPLAMVPERDDDRRVRSTTADIMSMAQLSIASAPRAADLDEPAAEVRPAAPKPAPRGHGRSSREGRRQGTSITGGVHGAWTTLAAEDQSRH